MFTYNVTVNNTNPFKLEAENLTKAEAYIIKNYMDRLADKSTAHIYHNGKLVTFLTKDKTKKHHTHNGYMFSA